MNKFKSLLMYDIAGPSFALLAVLIIFGVFADNFFSVATFQSVAYQLPVFGLLTLAMLLPILTGGLNLAITFSANFSGLSLAWFLLQFGGAEAPFWAFIIGVFIALAMGALSGYIMGVIIAYTGAHPILVSLSMMIFLSGLGEFLTKGGDISGFPDYIKFIGHGSLLGIPFPLIILIIAVILWFLLINRSKLGFKLLMSGSNIDAVSYSGINTKKVLIWVYTLSGLMCAIAGILMLARFNSVRVGHGESYLLITVLACFLGGVDPFGGFGKVMPVFLSLLVLQLLSSGLNLLGANQHLATAVWGILLLGVMIFRWWISRIK